MRILYVCTDADIGGAERFLVTLGTHRSAGDVVGLTVLMRRGSLSEKLEASFDEVTYLGFPPTSRNLPGMVRALEGAIHAFRPDVVSSHLFHADLVTALARTRVPKTSTVHTQGFGPADHPLTRLIARAVAMMSSRFAAVIPASDSPAMMSFLSRLRMKNVVAPILNGAEIPERPRFDATQRRFTSIARNHPVKGHRVLFEAFARIADDVPGWSLRAVGPGVVADNEAMQVALSGHDDLVRTGRIELAGPTSQPEEALAESSALVISSIYGEAFPIVGAEAAGLGVPVIATDVGNCAEFADDPRFVVTPGDVASLADALRVYASLSDDERRELSATARRRAELRYSPRSVATAYRAVFADVIARGRR